MSSKFLSALWIAVLISQLSAAPLPLQIPRGSMVIYSTPPGAQVVFNSTLRGTTPVVLKLTKKVNHLVVSLSGYETYDGMIEKSATRRNLTVNLILKPEGKPPAVASAPAPVDSPIPAPEKPEGTVFFSSSPPHADIVVDGKPTGLQTPLKIGLSPGIHHVEMRRNGLNGAADDTVNLGNNKALHLPLQ